MQTPFLFSPWRNLLVLFLILPHSLLAQQKSIILGRPTQQSITASILFDQAVSFYLEYGTQAGVYNQTSPTMNNQVDVPDEVELSGLQPNTRYHYRLRWKPAGTQNYLASPEYDFMTQRPPGSTFRFTLEADEHLYDKKGVRNMYKVTLANQAADKPDFMLSLGDIFGDDHTPLLTTSEDMKDLHKDYLQYLTEICHSVPFYVCLGNHEGENGYFLNQTPPNNIAVYGTQWRKFYYPNPFPNSFYSGNQTEEPYGIGKPENYFAWTWGDALFVVLDVYRDCSVNDKPIKWDWTLGQTQYNWLKTTLENSNATFKFVFAHHTRGQGRGGKITATGFEWGGMDNGQYKFPQYRPGWDKPIHQLMKDNGVQIFFQGHDHLYAMETLDSLVYHEVPMAADSTYEIGILANADAYDGVVLGGTGHVRVTVSPQCAQVDFVRAYLPQDTVGGIHVNGEIAHSYTVGPCTTTRNRLQKTGKSAFRVQPNPAQGRMFATWPSGQVLQAQLLDLKGRQIHSITIPPQASGFEIQLPPVAPGTYLLQWSDPDLQTSFHQMLILE